VRRGGSIPLGGTEGATQAPEIEEVPTHAL
jgi:hypothetical protein